MSASIGTCTMKEDGTLVLNLRAEDSASGTVGHSQITYERNHPQYLEILEHIGPIQVGETRAVAPWPE